MNKYYIIARREYLKIVTKKVFWFSTLFFPVFIIVISLISGASSSTLEDQFKNGPKDSEKVIIIDKSGLLTNQITVLTQKSNIQKGEVLNEELEKFNKEDNVDAVIYFPENLLKDKKFDVYQKDKGIFGYGRYSSFAEGLIKQSIISEIKDQEKISAYYSNFSSDIKNYKDGQIKEFKVEQFIVPIAAVMIYFVLTTFATSYLLLSVAEEKENRMIEIILAAVKPKELIVGKIVGQVMVVLTQVLVLAILSLGALVILGTKISIDLSNINLNPLQIILTIFYLLAGFLILACLMVGVGSAVPSYREAQGTSSIFVILSIFPVYFASLLIAEPAGVIAKFFSYFPLTSGLVLLYRNSVGALANWEIILSIPMMIFYIILGFILAFKLFELGSLEFGRRVGLVEIFRRR